MNFKKNLIFLSALALCGSAAFSGFGNNFFNISSSVSVSADENNTAYQWYLEPSIDADEVYTYDFEAVNEDNMNGRNNVYDWFAVVKKDGFYNIVDYNGKQYLKEKYINYFEHACVGIMFDKADGEEVTEDYTRDYNAADNKFYNGWADKNLTIWYNSDTEKIEFVKGGSSAQGHGGKPGVIYTLENNEIVYHDYGLEFGDYPNDYRNDDLSASLNEFNKNHALVIIDTNSNKFGIAYNNQEIVPCSYKKVYENGNFTWLGNDDNWELYDSKGNKVLDFVCNSVNINTDIISSDFNNFICSNDSGLMDYSEESIPFLPTENKLAVYNDNGCAYFGTDGSQITNYGEFEEIRPVHNNLAWVKKDGKWGVIQFGEDNTYTMPEISEIGKEAQVTETTSPEETTSPDETTSPEETTIKSWQEAYADFISGKNGKFSLIYIDNDDIPELIYATSDGGSGISIYKYSDGEVISVDNCGFADASMNKSVAYLEKQNLICVTDARTNGKYYYLYTIENDELKEKGNISFGYLNNDFSIDGNPATEDECNAKADEYKIPDMTVIDRSAMYDINEENVIKYLSVENDTQETQKSQNNNTNNNNNNNNNNTKNNTTNNGGKSASDNKTGVSPDTGDKGTGIALCVAASAVMAAWITRKKD